MQRLICVIGNKGGTGKTTITHVLCHGLGLLGWRAIAILTDSQRQPLSKQGRRYVPVDGREPEVLDKIVAKLETTPDWLAVIDGGGNRPALDRQFYEMSGMALLPFRDSPEDMRTVMDDLDAFPNAYALPSQWPTNPWQQLAAERSVDDMMLTYRTRILDPVYTVSASKQLLQIQMPSALPNALNNMSRSLAWRVLQKMGLPRHAEPPHTAPNR
ncbi:MAG: hypothetical protein EPN21_01820 [Methylococcaceae bacterium]|nr:MAG: hypothetical protein EPN21_01820 [Methylococcaceae bacterium]